MNRRFSTLCAECVVDVQVRRMQCGSGVWVRWLAADDGVAELRANPNPSLGLETGRAERLQKPSGHA